MGPLACGETVRDLVLVGPLPAIFIGVIKKVISLHSNLEGKENVNSVELRRHFEFNFVWRESNIITQ